MNELLTATSHLIPGCGQMVSERSELIGLWSGTEERPAREAAVGWSLQYPLTLACGA